MKRLTLFAVLVIMLASSVSAAKRKAADGEIIKSGWNFGPLPVVGFDSDLGFQYGVCCDIFNYGDGTYYPEYKFKLNVEASTYTKGSSILRCYGDFKNVIPDGKLFFDVTYQSAGKFGFYGFNGFASPYSDTRVVPMSGAEIAEDAKSGFNYMNRNQFRALASIQKKISGDLKWAAGLAYYNIRTEALDRDKFDTYAGQQTLYELYRQHNLIRENEAEGGNVLQLRAGIIYDSRDHDSDPTRGFNIEATLTGSPDIDGKGYGNMGFTFLGSQYVPVVSEKLTFAYRLGVQAKICGEIPYYFINNVNTMFFRRLYTEGLGGNTSVRGLNRNGVIGDGTAWLNLEFRWRVFDFQLIKQNWGIALNPFFDAGQVIQSYRLEEQKKCGEPIYSDKSESPHCTAGLGVKLVMNHNMVISVEAAKPFNTNDGSRLWTNIGFNYLF